MFCAPAPPLTSPMRPRSSAEPPEAMRMFLRPGRLPRHILNASKSCGRWAGEEARRGHQVPDPWERGKRGHV